MGSTEAVGLLAAIIILFIAFGSLLAMSLPIIAAIAGVGIGLVFVTLLSHFITVPSFAPYVALMIGLGVGIDYALFIVVRYRSRVARRARSRERRTSSRSRRPAARFCSPDAR